MDHTVKLCDDGRRKGKHSPSPVIAQLDCAIHGPTLPIILPRQQQIIPNRIMRFDQLNLPLPLPMLKLLFPRHDIRDEVEAFDVNQSVMPI